MICRDVKKTPVTPTSLEKCLKDYTCRPLQTSTIPFVSELEIVVVVVVVVVVDDDDDDDVELINDWRIDSSSHSTQSKSIRHSFHDNT